MRQRKIKIIITALFLGCTLIAQDSVDVKAQAHNTIQQFQWGARTGSGWEAAKVTLNKYDKIELANALIEELDADWVSKATNLNSERAKQIMNRSSSRTRDLTVKELFQQLSLPFPPILAELVKTQSPHKKYQLMNCLPKEDAPEVIAALLEQLNDTGVAYTPFYKTGEFGIPVYPLRVCDIACNILNEVTGGKHFIGSGITMDARKPIIQQTIQEVKTYQQNRK